MNSGPKTLNIGNTWHSKVLIKMIMLSSIATMMINGKTTILHIAWAIWKWGNIITIKVLLSIKKQNKTPNRIALLTLLWRKRKKKNKKLNLKNAKLSKKTFFCMMIWQIAKSSKEKSKSKLMAKKRFNSARYYKHSEN